MRILRYFLVGGAAAVVDIGLFAVLTKVVAVHYLASGAVSFVAATLVNYVLSVRHVFESGARFSRRHEIGLVFLVSGVGLLINQLVLFLAVTGTGLDPVLAKIVATGIVFFWNYGARVRFVFRPSKTG